MGQGVGQLTKGLVKHIKRETQSTVWGQNTKQNWQARGRYWKVGRKGKAADAGEKSSVWSRSGVCSFTKVRGKTTRDAQKRRCRGLELKKGVQKEHSRLWNGLGSACRKEGDVNESEGQTFRGRNEPLGSKGLRLGIVGVVATRSTPPSKWNVVNMIQKKKRGGGGKKERCVKKEKAKKKGLILDSVCQHSIPRRGAKGESAQFGSGFYEMGPRLKKDRHRGEGTIEGWERGPKQRKGRKAGQRKP